MNQIRTLAIKTGVAIACAATLPAVYANDTTPTSQKISDLLKGTPISQSSTESKKNQTLIHECIQYCRPIKADYYVIRKIYDCSKIEPRGLAAWMGMNCGDEFKAVVEINTELKNRFGEDYTETSTCRWTGNEYALTASCGESSARSQEDASKGRQIR